MRFFSFATHPRAARAFSDGKGDAHPDVNLYTPLTRPNQGTDSAITTSFCSTFSVWPRPIRILLFDHMGTARDFYQALVPDLSRRRVPFPRHHKKCAAVQWSGYFFCRSDRRWPEIVSPGSRLRPSANGSLSSWIEIIATLVKVFLTTKIPLERLCRTDGRCGLRPDNIDA